VIYFGANSSPHQVGEHATHPIAHLPSALALLLLVAGAGPAASSRLATALLAPAASHALECGKFKFPECSARASQFGGGFKPRVGFGGFGGGNCKAAKPPVVFIHGNADRAITWDSPVTGALAGYAAPRQSVYEVFKAQGYNDCELFGVTYLSSAQRKAPQSNYHDPAKYRIIAKFIDAVKAYTGQPRVDIVAHSLGVSMSIAALTYYGSHPGGANWSSVRKFVNIAGGIRGLNSCLYAGGANVFVPTCGAENVANPFIFGFYPDSNDLFGNNDWTGDAGPFSLRRAPALHPEVAFYTLHAGQHDQIHCSTVLGVEACRHGALFNDHANVKAQLNVGAGATPQQLDFRFNDWSPFAAKGGDSDGVGHFKAKINTGEIIYRMLSSDCVGDDCKGAYRGGPVQAQREPLTRRFNIQVTLSVRYHYLI
jgi:pimeloyl-ACP methyl ester carboxylesterase